MNPNQKRLHQLFFPIFFEILCMMLAGMVDTLMLSSESDQAVGAVGTANTYISIFIIVFSVISAGMVAVMTQYIGAGRPGVAHQALKIGLLINLIAGTAISAVLFFFAEPILLAVGISRQLRADAVTYLQVVGLFCVCNALTPIVSSYLRAFGHTAPTLTATMIANGVNLVLNAVFLFVFHWGVWGVALATGISRLSHLLWLVLVARKRIKLQKEANMPANRELLGKILRVGIPAAMETSLYHLALTIVISLLNQMDDTGMQATARAYALQLNNFCYCAAMALAQANAIMAGWRIGAGDLVACDKGTRKAALLSIGTSVGVACVFAIFADPLVSLFTDDPQMISLVGSLLVVDIFLEIGRASNLVFGMALKTSGDAVFPMVIAVVFAFLCAAGGTWLFGIHLGWLAVGAYAAMALDECVRAVCMFLRWHSGCWKAATLISKE